MSKSSFILEDADCLSYLLLELQPETKKVAESAGTFSTPEKQQGNG